MLGLVMDFFVQLLERNFGFFHEINLRFSKLPFKPELAPCSRFAMRSAGNEPPYRAAHRAAATVK